MDKDSRSIPSRSEVGAFPGKGKLDLTSIRNLRVQILKCVHYIHSQNIIHCDLKPSNIMFFSSDHSWRLLDLDHSVQTGQACRICYTPMYACPEVIQAEERGDEQVELETSADMWSFGIVAFETLTGFVQLAHLP